MIIQLWMEMDPGEFLAYSSLRGTELECSYLLSGVDTSLIWAWGTERRESATRNMQEL